MLQCLGEALMLSEDFARGSWTKRVARKKLGGQDCLPVELGGLRAVAALKSDASGREFTSCTWRSPLASWFLQPMPLFRALCTI